MKMKLDSVFVGGLVLVVAIGGTVIYAVVSTEDEGALESRPREQTADSITPFLPKGDDVGHGTPPDGALGARALPFGNGFESRTLPSQLVHDTVKFVQTTANRRDKDEFRRRGCLDVDSMSNSQVSSFLERLIVQEDPELPEKLRAETMCAALAKMLGQVNFRRETEAHVAVKEFNKYVRERLAQVILAVENATDLPVYINDSLTQGGEAVLPGKARTIRINADGFCKPGGPGPIEAQIGNDNSPNRALVEFEMCEGRTYASDSGYVLTVTDPPWQSPGHSPPTLKEPPVVKLRIEIRKPAGH